VLIVLIPCDNILRAVRLTDGREAYQIDTGAYIAASPVIHGGRAYVGTFNDEVLAFDLDRRAQVWRYADPDRRFPFYSSAALDPRSGRVIIGGRDRHIHAIDAATGEAAWTFATRARVDSSPVVAGDRIYVGSSDHRLYVLDVETGRKVWEFDTGAAITASPAVAGGRVVVGATDGQLYVFG
jgi:eukaryotic-like serine/threonine-protein kinase